MIFRTLTFKSAALTLSALAIAACTPSQPTAEDGLVISAARVQAPLKGKTISAGYFDITNHSSVDDAIIGVESPIAERVELHLSEEVDGIMKMRKQVSVDVKAGETVSFKPGSYHLMFFDMTLTDDQSDTALTFKFKHAPDVTIIADMADGANHSSHH